MCAHGGCTRTFTPKHVSVIDVDKQLHDLVQCGFKLVICETLATSFPEQGVAEVCHELRCAACADLLVTEGLECILERLVH